MIHPNNEKDQSEVNVPFSYGTLIFAKLSGGNSSLSFSKMLTVKLQQVCIVSCDFFFSFDIQEYGIDTNQMH